MVPGAVLYQHRIIPTPDAGVPNPNTGAAQCKWQIDNGCIKSIVAAWWWYIIILLEGLGPVWKTDNRSRERSGIIMPHVPTAVCYYFVAYTHTHKICGLPVASCER